MTRSRTGATLHRRPVSVATCLLIPLLLSSLILSTQTGCTVSGPALQTASSAAQASEPSGQPRLYTLEQLPEEDRALFTDTESGLFDARGLRKTRYRAPVPSVVPGANTLSDAAFIALSDSDKLLLIDVLPTTLREGRFVNTEGHRLIPKSFWLPNTGKAETGSELEQYFARELKRLMALYPDRTPVFYCRIDCWMSWNATLKAQALGVQPLYWYPDGTDGWQRNGRDLIEGFPLPLSP